MFSIKLKYCIILGVASHVTSKSAMSAPKIVPFIWAQTQIIKDKGSVKQNEKNKGKSQVSVRSHP